VARRRLVWELNGALLLRHVMSLRCQEARWWATSCGGTPGRAAGLQQEETGVAAPGMVVMLVTSSSSPEVVDRLKASCSGCVGTIGASSFGQRCSVLDPVILH
jgi:hypothetical protein